MSTRRTFLKAAGALAAGSIVGPVPWDALSQQKQAADPDNHYCDYKAFEEWWQGQVERYEWGYLDEIDGPALSAMHCIISGLYRNPARHES